MHVIFHICQNIPKYTWIMKCYIKKHTLSIQLNKAKPLSIQINTTNNFNFVSKRFIIF